MTAPSCLQLIFAPRGRRFSELDVNPSAEKVEFARKEIPSLNGDPEFEAIIAEYERRFPLKEEQDQSD